MFSSFFAMRGRCDENLIAFMSRNPCLRSLGVCRDMAPTLGCGAC